MEKEKLNEQSKTEWKRHVIWERSKGERHKQRNLADKNWKKKPDATKSQNYLTWNQIIKQ